MESTRQLVHRTLLDAESPMTIAELAVAIGVHRTVVAQHLRSLASDDLVQAMPLAPIGRGRPSTAYVAIDAAPYLTLAQWLATAAAQGAAPRAAGFRIGQQLAAGLSSEDTDTPIDHTVALIEHEARRLGFSPSRETDDHTRIDLRLDRCPFADIALDDLGVVCALHLGLVEGMASRSSAITVGGLQVADPRKGGCRLELRRVER